MSEATLPESSVPGRTPPDRSGRYAVEFLGGRQLRRITDRALRFQNYVLRRTWGVFFATWTAALATLFVLPAVVSAGAPKLPGRGSSGVSFVSTLRPARKRGFGESMTWRAMISGKEAGFRVGYLRASKMGEPVYRKMGFVDGLPYRTFHVRPMGAVNTMRAVFCYLGVNLWFAARGGRIEHAPWTSAPPRA